MELYLDNVSDLARVIRVPGSINHKLDPVPVKIVELHPDRRYGYKELHETIDELYSKLPREKTSVPVNGVKQQSGEYPPARADLILEKCAFLRHCKDDAATLPEPDWYFGLVSIIARTEEGRSWYMSYWPRIPDMTCKRPIKKIAHALKDADPTTCQVIQENCGDDYCRPKR